MTWRAVYVGPNHKLSVPSVGFLKPPPAAADARAVAAAAARYDRRELITADSTFTAGPNSSARSSARQEGH